jgi:hypothetical protein
MHGRSLFMPLRGTLQDKLDQSTLVESIMDSMGAQILFHPNVGSIPLVESPGSRTKIA